MQERSSGTISSKTPGKLEDAAPLASAADVRGVKGTNATAFTLKK
jgi:hypothetical protein